MIAAGHRLLRSSYDIDRVVGDPWTLRPDTLAALEHVPERMKIQLARFLAGHVRDTTPAGFSESIGAAEGESTRLSEDLSASLLPMLRDTFNGALSDDQLIDLGVFVLSKASFYPRSDEGWKQVKDRIVTYDVYLALAVVLASVASDRVQAGFSGWLWRSQDDRFRIGWYGNVGHLGRSLRPNASVGMRASTGILDANLGVRGNRDGDDRLALEAGMTEHWFNSVTQALGWDSQASLGARYNVINQNPSQQGLGSVSATTIATRHDLLGHPGVDLTVRTDVGADTHGDLSAHVTALLESGHGSLIGALDASGATSAPDGSPGRTYQLGAFVAGATESSFAFLRDSLRAEASAIARDLGDLERSERDLSALVGAGLRGAPVPAQDERQAELWLGLSRLHLRNDLARLDADQARYESERASADDASASIIAESLEGAQLKSARQQASGDTLGAENSSLYRSEQ